MSVEKYFTLKSGTIFLFEITYCAKTQTDLFEKNPAVWTLRKSLLTQKQITFFSQPRQMFLSDVFEDLRIRIKVSQSCIRSFPQVSKLAKIVPRSEYWLEVYQGQLLSHISRSNIPFADSSSLKITDVLPGNEACFLVFYEHAL